MSKTEQSATLYLIPLSKLQPHPENPRLILREDVISGIVANLNGEWPQQHALLVRPFQGDYQILSGHQRFEAAKRAGIAKVWAWSEEMDDDAALMALATSNNQGEWGPLEIGLHALAAIPTAQGKKGAGLTEYAKRIGKTQQYVSDLRQAAEVFNSSDFTTQAVKFLTKAKHLAAIHGLPAFCWPEACEWLISAGDNENFNTVEERVRLANDFQKTWDPGDWSRYLPVKTCMLDVFLEGEGTIGRYKRMLATAQKIFAELSEHADLQEEFKSWVILAQPDIKELQAKRIEFEEAIWKRENKVRQTELVQVLLADPPWQYDFAETSNRQIENQYASATVEEICEHVNAPWFAKVADNAVLYLWATAPKLNEALEVMDAWGFSYVTHAVWDKEKIGMGYWFRGQHELLLVGTRGEFSPPPAEVRVSSIFHEARGEHSVKPESVYQMIETSFPEMQWGEIYARRERKGWKAFGLN